MQVPLSLGFLHLEILGYTLPVWCWCFVCLWSPSEPIVSWAKPFKKTLERKRWTCRAIQAWIMARRSTSTKNQKRRMGEWEDTFEWLPGVAHCFIAWCSILVWCQLEQSLWLWRFRAIPILWYIPSRESCSSSGCTLMNWHLCSTLLCLFTWRMHALILSTKTVKQWTFHRVFFVRDSNALYVQVHVAGFNPTTMQLNAN